MRDNLLFLGTMQLDKGLQLVASVLSFHVIDHQRFESLQRSPKSSIALRWRSLHCLVFDPCRLGAEISIAKFSSFFDSDIAI